MKEIWRDIPEYEGLYQASTFGRVRSLDRIVVCKNGELKPCMGRMLAHSVLPTGYHYVQLWKDNKSYHCHIARIVAKTFIPNPNNLPEVDHINGNKSNNSIFNLRWVDRTGNTNNPITRLRNSKSKIGKNLYSEHHNAKPILQLTMDGELVKEWDCIIRAAETLGINQSLITAVARGYKEHHSAGGFRWEYATK